MTAKQPPEIAEAAVETGVKKAHLRWDKVLVGSFLAGAYIAFGGLVAPIEHVDVVTAPRAGAILFDVQPGDRVAKGDRLATIVHTPGEQGGTVDVCAPQGGYVLTRVSRRSIYAGDDLVKLV